MLKRIPRRKFLSMLAPAVGLAGCGGQPVPAFRVATITWPGYEPLFLARSLGYFGDHRIQLLEFPSSTECILAFQNRLVDAITVTLDEVVRIALAGHDPRVVLVLDYSNGADVILAKPEIASLAQIKGRVVGVESNTLGAFVLSRALETCGLSLNDVKIVSHRVDRLEREFMEGRIEAVVTFEPFRTRLREQGARQIFDSTQIPGEITDVFVVRKSTADQPPAALRALVRAWFRAVEYIAQNGLDAATRMAPRESISPEQFLKTLADVQLLGAEENRRLLTSPDSPLPPALHRLSEFLAKNQLTANAVDTAKLLDGRLVAAESR